MAFSSAEWTDPISNLRRAHVFAAAMCLPPPLSIKGSVANLPPGTAGFAPRLIEVCPPANAPKYLRRLKTMAFTTSSVSPPDNACCVFDTAIGVCGLAWSPDGLLRLQLPEQDAKLMQHRLSARTGARPAQDPPPAIAACVAALRRYFTGRPVDFREIMLDLTGVSAFNADIYRALRDIGWRQTTTYGALAKRVGNPQAAQAVGVAMATNPWPIIVPCHRVLAAAGKLGGYSAPGGAATKLKLLRMEGAAIDQGMPLFGD